MSCNIKIIVGLVLFCLSAVCYAQDKPNVLFIAVDDLNCDFNAYGNTMVKSPHLDKLAAEGTLFANNHCAQAVCGPSRASLLTGQMPQKSRITSFYKYFRDMYPDMITLPLFFKNNGYHVEGVGKIHDFRNVSEFNNDTYDAISWNKWNTISGSKRYCCSEGNPATEMGEVADNGYNDGKFADLTVKRITQLAKNGEPFFFAVGFHKPHLPFTAPKKYWDLYQRDEIKLAEFKENAANDYDGFYNRGSELRNNYDNIPKTGDIPEDLQRELIHGYYACVSFIDAQVGKVLDALKASGEYDNTIIVFWGDHGWHLGDHNQWTKHTNFEQATRSPLIIKAPGFPANQVTNSPTGHIDIFPTLVDLAGFEIPSDKDGKSLKPILQNADADVNEFTVSRYTRDGYDGNALRNKRYRYVEWKHDSGDMKYQLFDYETDPLETVNLAYMPEYENLISKLSEQLNAYLETLVGDAPGYNFGFENVVGGIPAGWSKTTQKEGDGTMTADMPNAHTGNYCMKVKNKRTERIQDVIAACDKTYKTSGTVKISFYAKGSAGTKMRINALHLYSSDSKKYTSSPEFSLSNKYQRFEFTLPPKESDAKETQVSFKLRFQMGSVIGDYYVDDVAISGPTANSGIYVLPQMKVYPNPARERITIENGKGEYRMFDVSGNLVANDVIQSKHYIIPISNLQNGIYLLKVLGTNQVPVTHLIVKE